MYREELCIHEKLLDTMRNKELSMAPLLSLQFNPIDNKYKFLYLKQYKCSMYLAAQGAHNITFQIPCKAKCPIYKDISYFTI